MNNSTGYRILQDDEDKWACEIPVDPIFMENTDKIVVKVKGKNWVFFKEMLH